MNTLEAIRMRQSCRLYKKEQISDEELDTILKAANSAPVGMGKYNEVRLTVIQDKELLSKIDSLGGHVFKNSGITPTYGAPTVILVSTVKPKSYLDVEPYCNSACIIENMHLAATEIRLGSVYLLDIVTDIRKDEEICRSLNIPEGFIPTSAIAIGKASGRPKDRKLTRDKITVDIIR